MLLVTGITGHTGRYFLEELIKNKYAGPIRCIVREASDTSSLDKSDLNIEKMIGDVNDLEFINRAMKGINVVFHIVNIKYTTGLILAAISNNVPMVICVHTTGLYSKFKVASEEYKKIENNLEIILKGKPIKVVILRPTMIYGDLCDRNMSRFIQMVDKLRVFPLINFGRGLLQPVNARDLGKAYYGVLMMNKERIRSDYILSGEKPISLYESLKLISELLGKRIIFVNVPLPIGVLLARCLKVATLGKVDYIEKVQRMSEDRCFSHQWAKQDFGYEPEPFKLGIAREVKEYLSKQRGG